MPDTAEMTETERRARFHLLGRRETAIRVVTTPLREARDAYAQEADAEIRRRNDAIRETEEPLVGIARERAALARSLGGRTGTPEEHA